MPVVYGFVHIDKSVDSNSSICVNIREHIKILRIPSTFLSFFTRTTPRLYEMKAFMKLRFPYIVNDMISILYME